MRHLHPQVHRRNLSRSLRIDTLEDRCVLSALPLLSILPQAPSLLDSVADLESVSNTSLNVDTSLAVAGADVGLDVHSAREHGQGLGLHMHGNSHEFQPTVGLGHGLHLGLNMHANLGSSQNAPGLGVDLGLGVGANLGGSGSAPGLGLGLNLQAGLGMGGNDPGIGLDIDLGLDTEVNAGGSNPGPGTPIPPPPPGGGPLPSNEAGAPAPNFVPGAITFLAPTTQPVALVVTGVPLAGPDRGENPGVEAAIVPPVQAEPVHGVPMLEELFSELPDVNGRGTDTGAERFTFTPESSGLLSDATPFDLAEMDNALQEFLDQLADLRDNVTGWFSSVGPLPWVFVGIAAAAAMSELVRRRLQRAQNRNRLAGKNQQDASVWFSGINGL